MMKTPESRKRHPPRADKPSLDLWLLGKGGLFNLSPWRLFRFFQNQNPLPVYNVTYNLQSLNEFKMHHEMKNGPP